MEIQSNKNPQIKLLKSLEQKKFRDREKLFVIEGVRIVEDALKDGATFVRFFHAPMLESNSRGMELVAELRALGVEETGLPDKLFSEVAGTETPQGLLAIMRQPEHSLEDLFAQESLYPHIIMLNSVQDPGNLGTILRTAAGAGWAGAILTQGTVDLYNPKSLRATMGAVHKLPVLKVSDWAEVCTELRKRGYQVVAADLSGEKWHFEADFTRPTLLVLGNEGNGVEAAILENADQLIKIPMAPNAESLNVAIAAGILIFEGVRQKFASGM